MKQGLGTQLRLLIELLDGAVQQSYADAGLDYRPRYTPVMRVLATRDSATIGQLAGLAGLTQPAATQTVALMRAKGLLSVTGGADARQRKVALSAAGRALLPQLEACWEATSRAAASLDADLAYPLSALLAEAIAVLAGRPFGPRIQAAASIPPTTP